MAKKALRALLFYNPAAPGLRSGRQHKLDAVSAEFRARNALLDVLEIEGAGHVLEAGEERARRGYDMLIAWGGDGTVNEVGNVAARLELPLGILPAGTRNMLALALRIPPSLQQACAVLLHGARRRIKAGRAAQRLFFAVAGIGFDAEVCKQVSPLLKRRLGALAYIATGLRLLLSYRFASVSVRCDGVSFTGTQIILSNVPCYAGSLKLAPSADPLGRGLDLGVLKAHSAPAYVAFLIRLLRGRHNRPPEWTHFKGWTFSLTSSQPVPVQVDGDYCGTLPMNFEVVPAALEVIVPAGRSGNGPGAGVPRNQPLAMPGEQRPRQ